MDYPDIAFREAVTVEQQIEQAQQKLTRLKELAAVAQQRDKIAARLANELDLVEATHVLLTHIRQLVVDQVRAINGSKALARFIKELQPLAQTYGVNIVKVGNGELATLVLARK